MTARRPYCEIPGFEKLILEYSWLLSLSDTGEELALIVEVAVDESHPLYSPPAKPSELCYRVATIRFRNPTTVTWRGRVFKPFLDQDGTVLYGDVDSMDFEGRRFKVKGDFGELEVESEPPSVDFRGDLGKK